jgi:hypothetical protein
LRVRFLSVRDLEDVRIAGPSSWTCSLFLVYFRGRSTDQLAAIKEAKGPGFLPDLLPVFLSNEDKGKTFGIPGTTSPAFRNLVSDRRIDPRASLVSPKTSPGTDECIGIANNPLFPFRLLGIRHSILHDLWPRIWIDDVY